MKQKKKKKKKKHKNNPGSAISLVKLPNTLGNFYLKYKKQQEGRKMGKLV